MSLLAAILATNAAIVFLFWTNRCTMAHGIAIEALYFGFIDWLVAFAHEMLGRAAVATSLN